MLNMKTSLKNQSKQDLANANQSAPSIGLPVQRFSQEKSLTPPPMPYGTQAKQNSESEDKEEPTQEKTKEDKNQTTEDNSPSTADGDTPDSNPNPNQNNPNAGQPFTNSKADSRFSLAVQQKENKPNKQEEKQAFQFKEVPAQDHRVLNAVQLSEVQKEGTEAADNQFKPFQVKVDNPITMPGQKREEKANTTEEKEAYQFNKGGDMPAKVQSKMENSLEEDFSNVTIHKNSESATAMGAQAYAQGNNVHFAPGKYNPETTKGQELLGHELTHVKQQRAGKVKPTKQTERFALNDDQGLENEAEKMGAQAAKGETTQKKSSASKKQTITSAPVQQKQANKQVNATSPIQLSLDPQTTESTIANKPMVIPPLPEPSKPTTGETANISGDKPTASGTANIPGTETTTGGSVNIPGTKPTIGGTANIPGTKPAATVIPSLKATDLDASYKEEITKINSKAEEQKTHEPTVKKVTDAKAAAKPPENEKESIAEDLQVDKMDMTPTKEFEVEAFKTRLKSRISGLAPKDGKALEKLQEASELTKITNVANAEVQVEQDNASGNLEEINKEVPDVTNVQGKTVVPLPQPGPNPAVGSIDPTKVSPKKKNTQEVETPIQENTKALEETLAASDLSEAQLLASNEPEFLLALQEKNNAATNAVQSATDFRNAETGILSTTQNNAQSLTNDGLNSFLDSRNTQFGGVKTDQLGTISKDEVKRKEVSDNINTIFSATQIEVGVILSDMTKVSNATFNNAAVTASSSFKTTVETEVKAFKDGRRWWEKIGDFFTNIDERAINRIFTKARDKFINSLNSTINWVAEYVGKKLAAAKLAISNGKSNISKYVDALDPDLKQYGIECSTNVDARFALLEQEITDSSGQLIESIAQSYTENVREIDAHIEKLKEENKGFFQRALDAIDGVIKTIKDLKDLILSVLKDAVSIIGQIIKNPIEFLSNLINGVKQGFGNFTGNIQTHLQGGITGWLFGQMDGMGVTPPATLDLKGIVGFAGEVLGLSWDFIKAKLTTSVGAENVDRVESGIDMVTTLKQDGVKGVVDEAGESLSDVKSTVMDGLKSFLIEKVITSGITFILGLFNPAAGFVKACKMIIDVVKFFIERAAQIAALIKAVLDSLAAIASGNIAAMASAIENALGRSLPVVISFLASLMGLGGIAGKIRKIIGGVREKIEKAIDTVVEKIRGIAESAGLLKKKKNNKNNQGEDKRSKEQKQKALDNAFQEVKELDNDPDTTQEELNIELLQLKNKYRLKKLDATFKKGGEEEDIFTVKGEVNPTAQMDVSIDNDSDSGNKHDLDNDETGEQANKKPKPTTPITLEEVAKKVLENKEVILYQRERKRATIEGKEYECGKSISSNLRGQLKKHRFTDLKKAINDKKGTTDIPLEDLIEVYENWGIEEVRIPNPNSAPAVSSTKNLFDAKKLLKTGEADITNTNGVYSVNLKYGSEVVKINIKKDSEEEVKQIFDDVFGTKTEFESASKAKTNVDNFNSKTGANVKANGATKGSTYEFTVLFNGQPLDDLKKDYTLKAVTKTITALLAQAAEKTKELKSSNPTSGLIVKYEEAKSLWETHIRANLGDIAQVSNWLQEWGRMEQNLLEILDLNQAAFPVKPIHNYGSADGKATSASVDLLSPNRVYGSEPGNANVKGWEHLQDAGLTDHVQWVRFHLINHHFGGLGQTHNLVPTTSGFNNPDYENNFERPIKNTVGEKPGEIKGENLSEQAILKHVVWMNVQVTYYPENDPKGANWPQIGNNTPSIGDFPKKIEAKFGSYKKKDESQALDWNNNVEKNTTIKTFNKPPPLPQWTSDEMGTILLPHANAYKLNLAMSNLSSGSGYSFTTADANKIKKVMNGSPKPQKIDDLKGKLTDALFNALKELHTAGKIEVNKGANSKNK